mgnify:CR=1 FL=1
MGVTHECDYPPGVQDRAHVTRTHIPAAAGSAEIDRLVSQRRGAARALYTLDHEAMARLAPELVVTQTLCDVCAVDDVEVRQFAAAISGAGRAAPRVVYLEPTRLEHVLASIRQVAEAAGVAERGETLLGELRARIDAVARACGAPEGSRRPRVLVLEWLDPPFCCGHWTPELVQLAGGVEPLGRAGERSRRVSVEDVAATDPDVIIVACCGYSAERGAADWPALAGKPQMAALRAVREGRVHAVDGSAYFSRPGPRLVDSLELLAHVLVPDRWPLRPGLIAPRRLVGGDVA